MKILIVEDNKDLAGNIEDFLKKEGYIIELADTLYNAKDKLLVYSYDCIILDLMMPDGDGLDLLRYIKEEKINSGVLIISAKNALDDKIAGLDIGADDYLTKPFHLTELHARIRAIYRRNNLGGQNILEFNEIKINTDKLAVQVNGNNLNLTRKEYELLLFFMINKELVVSRQAITEHLWGDYTDNLANFDFVYQHIKNLRRKIARAKGNDYLTTVYGLGYKFTEKA